MQPAGGVTQEQRFALTRSLPLCQRLPALPHPASPRRASAALRQAQLPLPRVAAAPTPQALRSPTLHAPALTRRPASRALQNPRPVPPRSPCSGEGPFLTCEVTHSRPAEAALTALPVRTEGQARGGPGEAAAACSAASARCPRLPPIPHRGPAVGGQAGGSMAAPGDVRASRSFPSPANTGQASWPAPLGHPRSAALRP